MRSINVGRDLAVVVIAASLAGAGCGGGGSHAPTRRTTSVPTSAPAKRPARPQIDLKADASAVAKRSTVPILCYHQLRPQTAADAPIDRPYIMPPARFRAELDALAHHGYHTITPRQLLAYLTTGARLPRRPVMLTFDDSVDDQYRIALPELRRRHMTATFFVMTVVLGNDGYMTRREVRAIDRAGMTVAAHTWDHHRVDEYSGDDWRTQIDEPPKELASIVRHRIRFFAYPYGAWSRAAFPHLRHAGTWAAFQLTDQRISLRDPLMTIRRKIVNPEWSTDQFLKQLRGGFRVVGP